MLIETSVIEQHSLQSSATNAIDRENKNYVLLLSSSLLTDRMLLHTQCLEVLRKDVSLSVWATSARDAQFREAWKSASVQAEPFPEIYPFKEIPHNYLRRLNEYVWDFRQSPPSRMSMMRYIKDKRQTPLIKSLKLPARALAFLRMEKVLENQLERLLLNYKRSPEASRRLQTKLPDVLVTTGPHRYEEPAIVLEAKKLGIPILAFITSWDNLSTKSRTVFKYDGYLVWSKQMEKELRHFYPHSNEVPIYVIGAPQFDVFFEERFYQTREEFCASQGLRADLPIILYALGSPNFLPEYSSVSYLAEKVVQGDLGDVQLLVRPHPIHDNAAESELLRKFAPRVIVQQTSRAGTAVNARSQDENQITEWVNSFRHADVVVNLSSTAAVDAAIFDRPVVNLDFDPEPGQPNQALVKDINHLWTHFKPVAESGGVWLVDTPEKMMKAIKTYLVHPELHKEKRHWIANYVCEYLDGKCGERMAEAILDFAHLNMNKTVSL
jgi:hypothetical protein